MSLFGSGKAQRRLLALAAAALALVGTACSPKSDVNSAIAFVDTFHKDFNARNYPHIIDAVIDPDYKADVTPDRLEKIRAGLGELKAAKLANYAVLYELRAAKVRLDFESDFANGHAKEVFEVKQRDGRNTITGYRVDSPLVDKR